MWCFHAVRSLLPLSALLLAQCASSSLPRAVTVTKGERTSVTAQTRGTPLRLLNASSTSREKTYSDPTSDLSTKIVDDAALQGLLDILANEGFFDRAGSGVAPVTGSIIVEQGAHRWVMNPPAVKDASDPELVVFGRCHEYVRATFNQTMGFQTRTDLTSRDLERLQAQRDLEAQQIRERNAKGPPK